LTDARRLGEAFKRLAPRVTIFLMVKMRVTREEAEDLVQEVFVRLLARRASDRRADPLWGSSDEHLRNYVLRAAIHRAIDNMRRSRTARENALVLLRHIEAEAGHSPDPARDIIQIDRLHRAVSRLRNPYAAIFRLMLEEDLSLAAVARRTHTRISSIYVQYRRGLEQLRALLGQIP
jgi:RNA polymerase sigma factor (sigma-70 family)